MAAPRSTQSHLPYNPDTRASFRGRLLRIQAPR